MGVKKLYGLLATLGNGDFKRWQREDASQSVLLQKFHNDPPLALCVMLMCGLRYCCGQCAKRAKADASC
ncbi:hypothetical protein O9929_20455 [Vibrio lentus]|nr:hypothetical protein [Vibrio lentus]